MKAKYIIYATFIITGRGLVLAGKIVEGSVFTGDYIEFEAFQKKRRKKIIGVSGMRKTQNETLNTGLLIECENKAEIDELRRWKPADALGIISKEREEY